MQTLSPYLAEAVTVPFAHFALDVVTKATVLLLLAIAVAALLRRFSAALRHRLWCLTFAALILLPVLSVALPKWRLAVLPARVQEELEETKLEIRTTAVPATPTQAPAGRAELPLVEPPIHAERSFDEAMLENPAADLPAEEPLTASNDGQETHSWADVRRLFGPASIWLLGAAIAVLPLFAGAVRTFILRRRAKAIYDAGWDALLEELCGRLALSRRVELLETEAATMPMTWGLLRPVVLLPAQARVWSEPLRRVVLLHELAHVKRCDVGFQMLGRVTCALYWFHPLAWYALRRLRIERELACDDCVVLAGERASDYAAELLQIAQTYRPVPLAAAVAMAQRSNLEHRIRAMFDRACSHLPLSPRAARLLLVGVAMLVTTVAAVRLAPRAKAEEEDTKQAETESTPQRAEAGVSQENTAQWVVRGRVVDSEGQPVPAARLHVIRVDTETIAWTEQGRVLTDSRCQADGTFQLTFPIDRPFATREQLMDSTFVVLADAPGRACDWQVVQPRESEMILRLPAADAPVDGRILDLEGRPIAGVKIRVNGISSDAEDVDHWVEDARRNPISLDQSLMAQPISAQETKEPRAVARYPGRKHLRLGCAQLLPSAVSDEDGKFRLSGLGRDWLVRLELEGSGVGKTWVNVVTREMPAVPYPEYDPRFRVPTCFGQRFDFPAEPEQPIEGIVRDADSGQPLPGVEVRLNQYADSTLFVEGFLSAVTDEEGRYVLHGAPKPHDRRRSHRLRIVPGADQPYFRTEAPVAQRDGFEPVRCDVELKHAIWLRGSITDEVSGEPIQGLVEYYPFLSNKAAESYANFDAGVRSLEGERYVTRDDGSFELPALPGRGLIAFIAAEAERYPEADGAEAIADLRQQDGDDLNVYHLMSPVMTTAVREINPPSDAAEAVCNIALLPLDIARLDLLDPDGGALTGVVARRLAPLRAGVPHYDGWSGEALPTAKAEIIGPRDQPRSVMFLHRQRGLAAAVRLTPQSDPPKQVVLRPYGAMTGQIVDGEGKPVPDLFLLIGAAPEPGATTESGWEWENIFSNQNLERLPTDRQGKFRVDIIPPGVEYVILASRGPERLKFSTPVIEPGQTLDLGDLTLEEPKVDEASGTNGPTENVQKANQDNAERMIADQTADGQAKTAKAKAPATAANIVNVRGRVLDPDGKPLAGAKVYFRAPGEEMSELQPQVRTQADGRFAFAVDKSKLKWISADDPWSLSRVIAAAEGYGYEWAEAAEPDDNGEYVIRLVKDVPIRGRILSLEGEPVAKAKLTVRNVTCYDNNNLDAYIEAQKTGSRNHGPGRFGRTPPGQPGTVETDAEGRFTLRGIGAERVVSLLLEGNGIANAALLTMTRETETVVLPESVLARPKPDRTFGASFTYLAQPSRVIRGLVRDRDTQKPIADVTIVGWGQGLPQPTTKTDDRGSFELHGLGKADRYFVDAMPAYTYAAARETSPFLASSRTIDDTPGLDPIQVAFELVRGIQISGRVTLAPSGRPNAAQVMYYPLRGNPYTDRIGKQLAVPCSSATCDADGRYTISVLPGPGILCYRMGPEVGSTYFEYPQAWMSQQEIKAHFEAVGLPSTPGPAGDNHVRITAGGPRQSGILLTNYKQFAFINPPEDATSLTRDIEFPLGRKLDVKLVDPDGKPVAGASIRGEESWIHSVPKSDPAEFTLVGLNPRVQRRIIVESRERKLAAYRIIRGDEPSPLTIKLEPCGTVIGRAFDVEGEPLANMQLQMSRPRYGPADFTPKTDRNGKFRVEGVVPGVVYNLAVRLPGQMGRDMLAENFILKPGETKNLGDVRIKPPGAMMRPGGFPQPGGNRTPPGAPSRPGARPKPPAGNPAKPSARRDVPAKDEPPPAAKPRADGPSKEAKTKTTVRGHVLDPDGKPLAGAKVYFRTPGVENRDSKPQAVTKADGGFEFVVDRSKLKSGIVNDPWSLSRVIATADGYGYDWAETAKPDAQGQYVIRLVNDVPIRGRILSLEGAPVAKARLTIRSVRCYPDNRLDDFIEARRTGIRRVKITRFGHTPPGQPDSVETDADGRFTLGGVGAERVVEFELAGDGIGSAKLHVMTRETDTVVPPETAPFGMILDRAHGAVFTYLAQPSRLIRGAVHERGTKQPIAGVTVSASAGGATLKAKTDEAGQFELHGYPKSDRYRLNAIPAYLYQADAGSSPYFASSLTVDDSPGLDPIEVNFDLARGIEVTGRVTLAPSGRPNAAQVMYYPLFGNSYTERIGPRLSNPCASATCDAEGRYMIPVLPGPGILVYRIGLEIGYAYREYTKVWLSKEEIKAHFESVGQKPPDFISENVMPTSTGGLAVSGIVLSNYNQIALINPADGEASLTRDIELPRGRTLDVKLIDPEGKPLIGAIVRGKGESLSLPEKLDKSEFTLVGLNPRVERKLIVEYAQRKLAAYRLIRADEKGPLTVRLEPWGAVIGRVLDSDGKPLTNTQLKMPRESIMPPEFAPKTDRDGKFRVEGVIPSVTYNLMVQLPGDVGETHLVQHLVVKSGETKDLGALRLKPAGMMRRPRAVKPTATPNAPAPAASRKGDGGQKKPSLPGKTPNKPAARQEPPRKDKPVPTAKPRAHGSSQEEAETRTNVTLRGRVQDPDGKPLAGAKVYLTYPARGQLESELLGASGGNGRFEFGVDASKFDRSLGDTWKFARLTAAAKGYGVEWTDAAEAEKVDGCTLQLVKDVPIHGRILTLEGAPATGAKVRLQQIDIPLDNNLDGFIEARLGQNTYRFERAAAKIPGVPASAEVDDQGRFTLEGYGAERLVVFEVEGPGIESWVVRVMTRETEPLVRPTPTSLVRADRVYGATFDHLAAPGRNIVGIVRQRGSGQPIAGVKIDCRRTTHATTTDAEGRFELLGAAKAKSYQLFAKAVNLPYFSAELNVVDTPGLGPIHVDIDLVRGIAVKGRVTIDESGAPNPAFVEYYPLQGNPHIPRLGDSIAKPCASAICDADGRYTISALPGPGVLCFRAGPWGKRTLYMSAYVSRQEVDDFYKSVGLKNTTDESVAALPTAPYREFPENYNEVVFLSPSEDEQTLTIDAEISIGRVVKGTVLDPAGQPLAGAEIIGLSDSPFEERKLETARFEVAALNPRRQRTLIARRRDRSLAAYRLLSGDEPGPIEIRMQPCGALVGRLIDEDDEPVAKTRLRFGRPRHTPEGTTTTDADGRFRLDELVPEMEYEITTLAPRQWMELMKTPIVAPGETKELGEVRLKSPQMAPRPKGVEAKKPLQPAAPKPAKGEKKASTGGKTPQPGRPLSTSDQPAGEPVEGAGKSNDVTLRGRVLLPDGRPAVGAELYWPHLKSPRPRSPEDTEYTERATSDVNGRFAFAISASEFARSASKVSLFAMKSGYGLAWFEVARGGAPQDVALRLVEDHPIRGRVTDTEGRPIAKARIAVRGMMESSGGKLDEFLAAWKRDVHSAFMKLDRSLHPWVNSLLDAETDSEGRFELSGIGLERVASLGITAPGFKAADWKVINRDGFEAGAFNKAALGQIVPLMRDAGLIPQFAGQNSNYIVEAGVTVRGHVYAGADREPVRDAVVSAAVTYFGLSVWAKTDADGRYELRGLPRNHEWLVSVEPPVGGNLLKRTLPVNAATGAAAADLDVELKPGIIVEGRVFDRATGKGVRSGVWFVPLPGNAFVDQPGYDGFKRSRVANTTDHDGRFRLMIIPGPGVLMASTSGGGPKIGDREITPYRQASFSEEERKRALLTEDDYDDRLFTAAGGSSESLTNANAVKVLDAVPESGKLRCEMPLDLGKRINIAIEDDQGQPLSDVFVAGLTETWPDTFRIAASTCTIYALGADRPRRVCLLHPERRLAAALTLMGDEQEPVSVRLAPAASISGRAVDDGGAPLGDAVVTLNYVSKCASELQRFLSIDQPATKTDAQGRFRVKNIVPGERFALDFSQGDAYFCANLTEDQRQLKAGQELDLGDAKLKRLR